MRSAPQPHEINATARYVERLRSLGVIDTAWRKEGTNVACATTHGAGVHLLNFVESFDADVHLICDTDGVREAGNLPESIPDEDHGEIYFNVKVHGRTPREDW